MTRTTDVVLVYPQRAPKKGKHWIMPSLGLMYLSASLRREGAGGSREDQAAPAAAVPARPAEPAVHRVLAAALEGRDDAADEHARLPVPVRVLPQAGVRRPVPGAARRHGDRGDAGDRRA